MPRRRLWGAQNCDVCVAQQVRLFQHSGRPYWSARVALVRCGRLAILSNGLRPYFYSEEDIDSEMD